MSTVKEWIARSVVVLVIAFSVPVGAQDYVWGTSSASQTEDPGYEGYWKYCLDIGWDVTGYNGYGLSHLDVLLGSECECVCNGYFAFADTVGSGPGTTDGETCTVYYFATLQCDGDPAGPPVPTIKLEYYENGCEPDKAGTMHVCFYSLLGPTSPGTFPDALVIKFGPDFETGDLVGEFPDCKLGPSTVGSSAWGQIKALYR